jgi:hypothetical protein
MCTQQHIEEEFEGEVPTFQNEILKKNLKEKLSPFKMKMHPFKKAYILVQFQ